MSNSNVLSSLDWPEVKRAFSLHCRFKMAIPYIVQVMRACCCIGDNVTTCYNFTIFIRFSPFHFSLCFTIILCFGFLFLIAEDKRVTDRTVKISMFDYFCAVACVNCCSNIKGPPSKMKCVNFTKKL